MSKKRRGRRTHNDLCFGYVRGRTGHSGVCICGLYWVDSMPPHDSDGELIQAYDLEYEIKKKSSIRYMEVERRRDGELREALKRTLLR